MRRRLHAGLLRLPGGFGYRIARALHVRKVPALPVTLAAAPLTTPPAPQNGSGAPLHVELEESGRRKRLRVRASGDIWSQEFRDELAEDRRFEASLVWRELIILAFIAVILVARTLGG
jgi:hypothetical protein